MNVGDNQYKNIYLNVRGEPGTEFIYLFFNRVDIQISVRHKKVDQ
jgi:hypothetical protein